MVFFGMATRNGVVVLFVNLIQKRSGSGDRTGPETDGRFFKHKKPHPHLPQAVFSSGEAHVVRPAGEQLPAASPLFEHEPSQLQDPGSMQHQVERRRTSWMASPQTQQLLANMATNSQLSRVDQSFLTMPGLMLDSPQVSYSRIGRPRICSLDFSEHIKLN